MQSFCFIQSLFVVMPTVTVYSSVCLRHMLFDICLRQKHFCEFPLFALHIYLYLMYVKNISVGSHQVVLKTWRRNIVRRWRTTLSRNYFISASSVSRKSAQHRRRQGTSATQCQARVLLDLPTTRWVEGKKIKCKGEMERNKFHVNICPLVV